MKDIEPIHSLAFSMQAQHRLYALLLGSGISKTAIVPTGWDVVLDFIGKLAAMEGDEPKDPYQWYRTHYEAEPDYLELLERFAPAPADRQQLRCQLWERNPADVRGPTKVHRAIADLAMEGFIKVIVTTNFDHLIENALREVGVEPMILRSPDDIAGMTPLEHTECCVLKLHGDYMDRRLPTHNWLFETLRPHAAAIILSEKRFERVFYRTEILLSLAHGVRTSEGQRWHSFTGGCFVYGDHAYRNTVAEIDKSLKREGNESPFVRHGLVGHSAEYAMINLKAFCDYVGGCATVLTFHSTMIRKT